MLERPAARSIDERDCLLDQVAVLWRDGLSQSRIAEALGFTDRGTVSGAIDRARKAGDNRFPPRPRLPGQTRELRLERDRERKARKRAGLPPAANPASKIRVVKPAGEEVGNRRRVSPSPKPVGLEQLEPGQCRYPVNDPAPHGEFLFCSAPALNGRYCLEHEAQTRVASRAPLR